MREDYLLNGTSLALDPAKCSGCRACADVCPHAVFSFAGADRANGAETGSESANGRAPAIAHRERCMECGACALNCAAGAITVRRGVGCAAAIIGGMLRGTPAECGCGVDRSERKGCC